MSLQAEVQQLRDAVARTSDELAAGAIALEAVQGRHQALVQRQAAASAGADSGRAEQQRAHDEVRALARQAYMGASTPRLPLVLTNDLKVVADLAYLRRSLDRVGAAQGAVLVAQVRSNDDVARELRGSEALRLSSLDDQHAIDARLASLTDRAAELLVELQTADTRLQARLAAERQAALTRAEQRRAAAAAAALRATQLAQQAAAFPGVPPTTASTGGCQPPGLYGGVNGFLPDEALCPLQQAPGHRLQTAAARGYDALSAARKAATGAPLCLTDSYRSYAEQVDVFRRKPGLAATPGRSQHGLGLAVDLCGGVQTFGSEAHAWMLLNAAQFGWMHPAWAGPGGSKPEPWHWEYVGG